MRAPSRLALAREPFPFARLNYSDDGGAGGGGGGGGAGGEPTGGAAVLVTLIRDPLDRLVSAYKFWSVLHNPSLKQGPAVA